MILWIHGALVIGFVAFAFFAGYVTGEMRERKRLTATAPGISVCRNDSGRTILAGEIVMASSGETGHFVIAEHGKWIAPRRIGP